MNALAHGLTRTPNPFRFFAQAVQRLNPRKPVQGTPAPTMPQGSDTEIRLLLARDVPSWARRDLGLDPNSF